ncbi:MULTISPECIES: hypothetical protein [unclassified Paenibacillus]|uniref:hypothetical protein n=1 Tax=unclassified Paenibacillus TaxID=185978 RepID=UPI0012F912DB|nr:MULTISPECIES: hypothetical protein [unclassified Paenibacillus]MCM3342581.1 hypothetical protein [Paenibacillus sp. MER TA 81-3]
MAQSAFKSYMTKQTDSSSTVTYSYEAFNRTAKVEKPDGSHIHHEYDPEGFPQRPARE